MKVNWFIFSILFIGLILLVLTFIPFNNYIDELNFHRFPIFEEEGYIVKPNK